MIYLFLSNITLLLCYALYSIFFKRLTFFQWNRIYLLGSVMLSLIIPIGLFIDFPTHASIDLSIPSVDVLPLQASFAVPVQPDSTIYLADVLHTLYWICTGAMFLWLLIRFSYVWFMVRRNRFEFSYTFFHHIAVKRNVASHEVITAHENVHARQGHSYDILFVQLVKVFNWFNPVIYLYLKELKLQHECIADEYASLDKVAYARLLVAEAMQVDPIFLQTFSNKSLLKKRIDMIFKNKSTQKQKYLYFSAAPILLLALISTFVFNTSRAKDIVRDIESNITSTELHGANGPDNPTVPEPAIGRTKFMEEFAREYVSPRAIKASDKDPFMALTFEVSKEGAISDFKLAEGDLGVSFFEEAVRIIKKTTWVPAVDNKGNAVAGRGLVMFKLDKQGNVLPKYTRVDVLPEPKGGITQWKRYIGENYLFPKEFVDVKQKGEFTLTFLLNERGNIEKLTVPHESAPGIANSAVELVKKFGPWVPGIFEREKVAYEVQLSFQLDTNYGYGIVHVGDVHLNRVKD